MVVVWWGYCVCIVYGFLCCSYCVDMNTERPLSPPPLLTSQGIVVCLRDNVNTKVNCSGGDFSTTVCGQLTVEYLQMNEVTKSSFLNIMKENDDEQKHC